MGSDCQPRLCSMARSYESKSLQCHNYAGADAVRLKFKVKYREKPSILHTLPQLTVLAFCRQASDLPSVDKMRFRRENDLRAASYSEPVCGYLYSPQRCSAAPACSGDFYTRRGIAPRDALHYACCGDRFSAQRQ